MKKIFLGTAGAFFVLILIGLTLSSEYEVKQTKVISGSIKDIHKVIGNLRTWPNWGPWMEDDPNMKITSTASSGVGATQQWTGKSGTGHLTFTHVDPEAGIAYELQFDQWPKARARFDYENISESQSSVTWTMNGTIPIPVIGGYMALVFQEVMGKSFEKGLSNIARIVEEKGDSSLEIPQD